MTRQQGFSLVEVLVALLIIGIATTTVSVAAFSYDDTRKLHQDARRLAQLFAVAQAHARKAGSPIIWVYDTRGYRFAQIPSRLFMPNGLTRESSTVQVLDFSGSSPLRPRNWTPANAIEVRIEPPGANVFNTEWISGPLAIELDDGAAIVRVERLGNGQYQVRQ